jgi:hypothetical protein
MRHNVLILAILSAVFAGIAFAQGAPPYYSVGGFGSVVNPGLGHPPTLPYGAVTGTGPLFPTALGANVAGRPFGYTGGGGRFDHGGPHGRTVIVPYPIYYGGYGYGSGYGYDPSQQQQPVDQYGNPVPTTSAPSVVINQNFAPDRPMPMVREYGAPGPDGVEQQPSSGMKLYQVPPSHPYADAQGAQSDQDLRGRRRAANDDEPTVYLIAFKDHSIVQALGYWMEGSNLHYVSMEHSLNQASLDLIDRSLSQRLNDERGIEFKLPK